MRESKEKINGVKGMADVLPEQIVLWQYIEAIITKLMKGYSYTQIKLPLVERTNLFKRGIGEVTDIVEKEMFTFLDQNEESLTLRPEGTAGCVRSCIEHSLLRNQQTHRLWYLGPMFRYERPQKGRYRQFTQFGVEAFNFVGPEIEAEHLALCARLWRELGISDTVKLQLNNIGDAASRAAYKQSLVEYFNKNKDVLDSDSQRRLLTNPLRILDSKNPDMQEMLAQAPIILDYLDDGSRRDFAVLQQLLNELGIDYVVNPRIVRGLDYYNGTVFEWVSEDLGAQSAVCAGGRYDGLVEMLGGPKSAAFGFALGLERLVLLLEARGVTQSSVVDGYLICVGDKAQAKRLWLAEQIRNLVPNFTLCTGLGESSIASGFKKADKSGAKVALVVGDEELLSGTVGIKFLRAERAQLTVSLEKIAGALGDI